MTAAYVGLGANLGETRQVFKDTAVYLAQRAGITVVAKSSLYKTAPIGVEGDDFLNAVVWLETAFSAHQLLAILHCLEDHFGRERPYPGAPRALDLDLLLFGDETHATPELTVPHPRMTERAFVLVPLLQVAPEIVIPGKGRAAEYLAAVGHQRVEKVLACSGGSCLPSLSPTPAKRSSC